MTILVEIAIYINSKKPSQS